jgi:hypothetical protein
MSATRIVTLPAINRSVTLAAYVQAIKLAKANPNTTFKHGLTAWWPCTGREVMRQFRAGMHDRINQRVPYRLRGMQP